MGKQIQRCKGSQRGQSLTEFLAVLVVLLAVVLLHTQLSLSYVVSSYMKYTTFMAGRAEAVSGNSEVYTKALIGDQQNNKLSPVATIDPPQAGSYVRADQDVRIGYNILNFVPLLENVAGPLVKGTTQSVFSKQPGTAGSPEFFDNE